MTEATDRRADATRQQILRAAARQFAVKPYSLVSLDDILAEAEVTKGAMYFHFRSKHALALAVIDDAGARNRRATEEVLARQLSGLETIIDLSYLIAVKDVEDQRSRAGLNLIESIGRHSELQSTVLGEWVKAFAGHLARAKTEGDILEDRDPEDIARLLVSLYVGLRQTTNLDAPQDFLRHFEMMWQLVLPGFANPQRMDYLSQFVRRRTGMALSNAAPPPDSG